MTSREVTRFSTKKNSREVTRFYLVTKSTLYDFKRCY